MNRTEEALVTVGYASADHMKILTSVLLVDLISRAAQGGRIPPPPPPFPPQPPTCVTAQEPRTQALGHQMVLSSLRPFAAKLDRKAVLRVSAWTANEFFSTPSSRQEPLVPAEELMVTTLSIGLLSLDEEYCRALTGALFNFCYGRYLETGHRIGLLVHPFLGFVRALNAVAAGREPPQLATSFAPSVGEEAMIPLLKLCRPLEMFRALPHSPDPMLLHRAILDLGERRGYGALFTP